MTGNRNRKTQHAEEKRKHIGFDSLKVRESQTEAGGGVPLFMNDKSKQHKSFASSPLKKQRLLIEPLKSKGFIYLNSWIKNVTI